MRRPLWHLNKARENRRWWDHIPPQPLAQSLFPIISSSDASPQRARPAPCAPTAHHPLAVPAEIPGETHTDSSGFNPWKGAGCSEGWRKRGVTRKLLRKAGMVHVLQPALPLSKALCPGRRGWKGQFVLEASGRCRGKNRAGGMLAPTQMHRAASAGTSLHWDHAGKAWTWQTLHFTRTLTRSPNESPAPVPS